MTDEHKKSISQIDYTHDLFKVGTFGAIGRLLEAISLGHPMNVIRTHFNSYPNKKNIVQSIYHQNGALGFYKGFRWNIIPASFGSGIRWIATNTSDGITSLVIPDHYKTTRAVSIGFLSPAISTLFLCPFGRMRTLIVTGSKKTTLRHHVAEKGILDLWTGARMSFLRTATISIMFNVTYVNIVSHMLKILSPLPKNEATMTLNLAVVAAVAAAPHALLTTPMDMIKDQMQKTDGIKEHRLFRATKIIYQNYGLWGMFRTAPLKVMRSGWYFAFTTAFMYKMGVLPRYMQPPKKIIQESNLLNDKESSSPPRTGF